MGLALLASKAMRPTTPRLHPKNLLLRTLTSNPKLQNPNTSASVARSEPLPLDPPPRPPVGDDARIHFRNPDDAIAGFPKRHGYRRVDKVDKAKHVFDNMTRMGVTPNAQSNYILNLRLSKDEKDENALVDFQGCNGRDEVCIKEETDGKGVCVLSTTRFPSN